MKNPPGRRRIPTPLAIVLGVAAALFVLVAGAVLWIESEAGARFVERRASAASGREITLGRIDLRFGFPPGVRVTNLRIANPSWAKTTHLVDTELIDARVRLLPLFRGRIFFEDLALVQAKVGLEREEKRNTWTF